MHSDVYDCKQWKARSEPAGTASNSKSPTIKLLFCYDGIPAHNCVDSESLIPGEVMCLSQPPWERYKEDNIMICFLMQDGLSAEAQKKFFDKIIEVDFRPLFMEGVTDSHGNRIRVEIFGQVVSANMFG